MLQQFVAVLHNALVHGGLRKLCCYSVNITWDDQRAAKGELMQKENHQGSE